MKVTVPITITKAGQIKHPVSLDVDNNKLAGYETDSDPKIYSVSQDGDDVYIGAGDDGIYINVFSNGEDSYGIKLGDSSIIPSSDISDMPYDVDPSELSVRVYGIDPATSKLICNISILPDSGDGNMIAENVLIDEDVDTLIPLESFVAF